MPVLLNLFTAHTLAAAGRPAPDPDTASRRGGPKASCGREGTQSSPPGPGKYAAKGQRVEKSRLEVQAATKVQLESARNQLGCTTTPPDRSR